jgi:hypothetical protein
VNVSDRLPQTGISDHDHDSANQGGGRVSFTMGCSNAPTTQGALMPISMAEDKFVHVAFDLQRGNGRALICRSKIRTLDWRRSIRRSTCELSGVGILNASDLGLLTVRAIKYLTHM